MADEAKPDVWNVFSKRYEVTDPRTEMPGKFREPENAKKLGKPKKKPTPRAPASKSALRYYASVRAPRMRRAEVKYELPKCEDCGCTIKHHKFCATPRVSLKPKRTVRWVLD